MTQPLSQGQENTSVTEISQTQPLENPESQESSQPIVVNVGNEESARDQILAFDILNTMVAQADMRNAARPRRGPPTPEHVLICADPYKGSISHILYFEEPHHPGDIVEAFENNTLNFSDPDEGFDASNTDDPPPPPPPTPASSTEAVHGSSTESDPSLGLHPPNNEDEVHLEEDPQEGEEEGRREERDHAR